MDPNNIDYDPEMAELYEEELGPELQDPNLVKPGYYPSMSVRADGDLDEEEEALVAIDTSEQFEARVKDLMVSAGLGYEDAASIVATDESDRIVETQDAYNAMDFPIKISEDLFHRILSGDLGTDDGFDEQYDDDGAPA